MQSCNTIMLREKSFNFLKIIMAYYNVIQARCSTSTFLTKMVVSIAVDTLFLDYSS